MVRTPSSDAQAVLKNWTCIRIERGAGTINGILHCCVICLQHPDQLPVRTQSQDNLESYFDSIFRSSVEAILDELEEGYNVRTD